MTKRTTIEISWTSIAIEMWRWLVDFYEIDIPSMPPLVIDTRKTTFSTDKSGLFSAMYGELKSAWRMFRDSGALVHYTCHIYNRATIAMIRRIWGTLAVPEEVYTVAMAHMLCHEMLHFVRIVNEDRKRLPADEIGMFIDGIGGVDDEFDNEALTLEAMKFYIFGQFCDTRYTRRNAAVAPRLWSPQIKRLGMTSQKFRTMNEALIIMEYITADSIRKDVIEREGLRDIFEGDGTFIADAIERHVKIARHRKTRVKVVE